jgi:hypothetical protein
MPTQTHVTVHCTVCNTATMRSIWGWQTLGAPCAHTPGELAIALRRARGGLPPETAEERSIRLAVKTPPSGTSVPEEKD